MPLRTGSDAHYSAAMANILDRWRRGRDKAPDGSGGAAGNAVTAAADDLCLDPYDTLAQAAATAPRAMCWSRAGISDPRAWQDAARIKLAELSGYGRFGGPPQVLRREDLGLVNGLHHESLYVRGRHGHDIPVRVVRRDDAPASPCVPVICLQGEGIGMHVSWGEGDGTAEAQAVAAGFDFAAEAARRGHVAVCLELMGAGERRPREIGKAGASLRSLAVHGMLLGHSLIGQHASDVSMVLNWIAGREFGIAADCSHPAVIGHDLGAAAGLLAAALDVRIATIAMVEPPPRFRDAIKQRSITAEMTMPGLLRWMDLDDIILLCAPRPIVAGPGRAGSTTAADLLAGARAFYDLFEAGPALTAAEGLAPFWQRLTAVLAEPRDAAG